MASLYNVTVEIITAIGAVFNKVDPETGEILDASVIKDFAALDGLKMDFRDKVENTACYIKNLESDAEQLKAEARKLTDRAKAKESRAESLRRYIAESMQATGETKIDTPRALLSFRPSEAVEIPDESVVSKSYCKVTYKPDKKAIKEALKAGKKVKGAALVTRQNLQIK